jgi:hypothetical protein
MMKERKPKFLGGEFTKKGKNTKVNLLDFFLVNKFL